MKEDKGDQDRRDFDRRSECKGAVQEEKDKGRCIREEQEKRDGGSEEEKQ